MSGKTSAGQEAVTPRPRRRGAEEGRIVTNVPACLGTYIAKQAEDLGISPSTYARMMLVECVKSRGLTMKDLETQYPTPRLALDARTKEARIASTVPDDEAPEHALAV